MPLAVDTNVLARALVDDGSEQAARALRCVKENSIFVPETVLLETEWLLRSQLSVPRDAVRTLLTGLLSLENIVFDNRTKIATAVSCYNEGMDFADALHLLSAGMCEEMASFDRDFARRSAKISEGPTVREP